MYNILMAEENTESRPVENQAEQKKQSVTPSSGKPSSLWYLVAIILGWIGGLIAYLVLREKDSKRALNVLIVGIVVTVVPMVLIFSVFFSAMALSSLSIPIFPILILTMTLVLYAIIRVEDPKTAKIILIIGIVLFVLLLLATWAVTPVSFSPITQVG